MAGRGGMGYLPALHFPFRNTRNYSFDQFLNLCKTNKASYMRDIGLGTRLLRAVSCNIGYSCDTFNLDRMNLETIA